MRTRHARLVVLGITLGCGLLASAANGQTPSPGDVRYFNGTPHRYQVETVQQPYTEQRTVQREETVTRPRTTTEWDSVQETYYAPVVRYDWQPRWHHVWNPFVPATLAYHYTPRMQWEPRIQTVQLPRTATRWVQEKRLVDVPQMVAGTREVQRGRWVAMAPESNAASTTRVATAPSTSNSQTFRGAMPVTNLGTDPYSRQTYSAPTIFR